MQIGNFCNLSIAMKSLFCFSLGREVEQQSGIHDLHEEMLKAEEMALEFERCLDSSANEET